MIHQIASIQPQTGLLPKINKGLIQVRHIQAQLKERMSGGSLPDRGEIWSPMTAGPFIVPVTRWIE